MDAYHVDRRTPPAAKSKQVTYLATSLLIVGFIAVLTFVGMAAFLNFRAETSFNSMLVARSLSSASDGLRSALQAAESSQRGYVISANEIYLAPYTTARDEAIQRLGVLEKALQGWPDTRPALDRLRLIVDGKFAEMDQVIAMTRSGDTSGTKALLDTNKGKALMDEANVFLSSFVRLGDKELRIAADDQRGSLSLLRTINLVAAALIVAVVAAVVWLLMSFARSLARARREVEVLNADLETRVEVRTAELAAARDRAELLMSEVNHRVANSLALVSSLVRMQARDSDDDEARQLLNEVHDRISAVGLVHKRLYVSQDVTSVDLSEYLASLVDQLSAMMHDRGHRAHLQQDLAPISISTDKSVSLGIVAAELITNALKYAYPDGAGEIRVQLERTGVNQAALTIADDGVGLSRETAKSGTGLGTRLVAAMVGSLEGTIEYINGRPGTIARVSFPA